MIDREAEFNNVTPSYIAKALGRKGVDPGINFWVHNMITSGRVSAEVSGSSVALLVSRGTPQEGGVPPLLWSLVGDDIMCKLEDKLGYCLRIC